MSTILVTGANGQLANEIKVIAAHYPAYQFLFTTKDELPIENNEALVTFLIKTILIIASIARLIPQ